MSTLAQETARDVKQWVDEQEGVARAFARTGDLNQSWINLSAESSDSDDFFLDLCRLHRVLQECNQSSPWITEVRLANNQGKIVLSDNSESVQGAFVPVEGGVKLDDVVQKGETRHSDVYLAVQPAPVGIDAPQLETGFPTMMIAAPIRGEGNTTLGVLGCRLAVADVGPIKFPTEAYSQPLKLYLTTLDGLIVSTNRKTEWKMDKVLIPPRHEGQAWPNAGDDMDGFVSHTGEEMVGAWARVPTMNLVVLVEVPLKTLLAPQHAALETTVGLCFVLCALGTLLAMRRADHLLAPLKILQQAAVRLALGDRTVRTQLEGDDELGQMSRTFDHMAATLDTTMGDMRQARDEAMEASRAKSRFVANMTHELRTPLNAVIGYSEMIMAEAKDGPVESGQLVEDLEVIRSSGQSLLKLVDEILDLSKIEAGKMDLAPEEFDVASLLREIITTISPLVPDHARLSCDVHGMSDTVFLDRGKVKQMLMNLLSNACKFTKRGEIRVRASSNEELLTVEVIDTGIGMSEAQQGKIFQEFAQAEDTSSRKYGGTGLGLAIVKRLATMMEGTISVTSELGKGSTFTLVLPRQTSPGQQG